MSAVPSPAERGPSPRSRVLSGIQPTADSFHLGNYLGAIRQWVALQETTTRSTASSTCTRSRSSTTRRAARSAPGVSAAQLLAAGLDPERVHAVRAEPRARARPAGLGARLHHRLRRGQPDDAVQGQVGQAGCRPRRPSGCSPTRSCRPPTSCSTRPTQVPVGEDQRQHLELTRDLAQRFNTRFGDDVRACRSRTSSRTTAKIYDLQDPTAKMSKSASAPGWHHRPARRPGGQREEDPDRRSPTPAARSSSTRRTSPASPTC